MRRSITAQDPKWESEYRNMWHMPPYTEEEKAKLEETHPVGSPERLAQGIFRILADRRRYQQAAAERPDMRPHYERLQAMGEQAIEGWKQHYLEQYDVSLPVVIPYDGTESILDAVIKQDNRRPTDEIRANILA